MVKKYGQAPIGVLALQGDVREHRSALALLGADSVLIRRPADLAGIAGLILPGGESTVIDKLSRHFGLYDEIRSHIRDGLPVYGSCAGMILLADRLEGGIDGQKTFGGLNATVRRNAFGTQRESFEFDLSVPVLGEDPVHAVFIRAPWIEKADPAVEILAKLPNGKAVAALDGNVLVSSFHPEVTGDLRLHRFFLEAVVAN